MKNIEKIEKIEKRTLKKWRVFIQNRLKCYLLDIVFKKCATPLNRGVLSELH